MISLFVTESSKLARPYFFVDSFYYLKKGEGKIVKVLFYGIATDKNI